MPAPAPLTNGAAEPEEGKQSKAFMQVIAPAAVREHWPRIEDMIRAAINANPIQPKLETPRDVLHALECGRYELHLIVADGEIKMLMVTQLQDFARTRVCHLIYGAGKDQEFWVEKFQSQFCEAAREAGCRFIQMQASDEARANLMTRHGFVETSRVYSLEI